MQQTSFCLQEIMQTRQGLINQDVWNSCFEHIKSQWLEAKERGVHASLMNIHILNSYTYQGRVLNVGDRITVCPLESQPNCKQATVIGLRNEVFGLSFANILVCLEEAENMYQVHSVFLEEVYS